jgi:hypothetical protein
MDEPMGSPTPSNVVLASPPSAPTSRSLAAQQQQHALHHSVSNGALGGNATFLSTSRALNYSRSEQCLSVVAHAPPTSSSASASSSQRKHHHVSSVSLQRCLSYTFNQVEVLQGDNAFMCDSCKRKVRAEKHTVIQALPPAYLFVHIGRTVYDASTYATKKDQTHIAFPLEGLDMTPFLPRPSSASAGPAVPIGTTSGADGSPPTSSNEPSYLYDLSLHIHPRYSPAVLMCLCSQASSIK